MTWIKEKNWRKSNCSGFRRWAEMNWHQIYWNKLNKVTWSEMTLQEIKQIEMTWEKLKKWDQLPRAVVGWEEERRRERTWDEMPWKKLRRHDMRWNEMRLDEMGSNEMRKIPKLKGNDGTGMNCRELVAAEQRRLGRTLYNSTHRSIMIRHSMAQSCFCSIGYKRFNFETSTPGLPRCYLYILWTNTLVQKPPAPLCPQKLKHLGTFVLQCSPSIWRPWTSGKAQIDCESVWINAST